ncbi:MAG: Asp23/Gls24 family envelope stress response protein [Chlamydiae bacterium]|nr:Asp23/Gls24 family envelope stress response protein [Chlamydiota bacterium]
MPILRLKREAKLSNHFKRIDPKEVKLPETLFIRDIESRVFQSIVQKCIEGIEGVSLVEGNLIDSFLGREGSEKLKGIHVEQDQKNHLVKIKVEINVSFGISLPEKAEEVQLKISKEVGRLTGLHVGSVHVVFKNLISAKEKREEEHSETICTE